MTANTYLVHITLATTDMQEITERGPQLVSTINTLSNGNSMLAYRSAKRDCLGFLCASKLGDAALRAAIDGTGDPHQYTAGRRPPPAPDTGFRTGDKILVIEIPPETQISEHGYNQISAWLHRH